MTFPAKVRTYNYTGINQRATFVSLNDCFAQIMYGIKNYLVATMGYTVKYTCDGTTGPTSSSDHTDRLASKTNCTTRGAAAGNAQSFWVLTDADGCDFLYTYQGGADDIGRLSFSPGGLFTPAGTSNQQPTATDEELLTSGTSLIGSTASGDRVWNCICSTDKKAFYVFTFRSNILVGGSWSLEDCTSTAVSPSVLSPAKCGTWVATYAMASFYTGSQSMGKCRPTVSSVAKDVTVIPGMESPSGSFIDGNNVAAQGSNGGLFFPLSGWSSGAGQDGKWFNFKDYYKDGNAGKDGDLTTDKNWIHLAFNSSGAAGVIRPWDGNTAVTTA